MIQGLINSQGDDTSPASFEKALSALAVKITKSQAQLDALRQRGRRAKALWTLYSSFAYLLCFIILFLVVGWKNWTAWEYSAVSGSPLVCVLLIKICVDWMLTSFQNLGYPHWYYIILYLPYRYSQPTTRGTTSRTYQNNRQAEGSNEI